MKYVLSRHAAMRMQERKIATAWLEQALDYPDQTEQDDTDDTLEHRLAVIRDSDSRVLRAVYVRDSQPLRIVTVHFDRSMKGKL